MCPSGSRATLALLILAIAAACGRTKSVAALSPGEALDQALAPAGFEANLRRAGGGHFHATAMFRADLATPEAGGGKAMSPPTVTTTTDLWMDPAGNFRLTERNDQEGGRDIVRVAGEIAVALRYGKLVRRPAQDAESSHYLGEGLGAPWAAWETIRRQVRVEGTTGAALRFRLTGEPPAKLPPGFAPAHGLRKWRETVLIQNLDGQALLDAATKLPVAFTCQARFQAVRDGIAIAGEVSVTATLDQIGQVPGVALPEAETLPSRQRTVLEERALLGGLGAAAASEAKKAAP